jgi:hypothetical protein
VSEIRSEPYWSNKNSVVGLKTPVIVTSVPPASWPEVGTSDTMSTGDRAHTRRNHLEHGRADLEGARAVCVTPNVTASKPLCVHPV